MTQKANYSITNLGVLPGFEGSRAAALNNNGQVVGTSWRNSLDFEPYGFLWHDGAMSGLGDVIPSDINDKGQIVGTSRKRFLNFTAHGDKPRTSPSRSTIDWVEAVSESGQVVGYSLFIDWNVPSKSKRSAFVLEKGERRSLATPDGYRAGKAVGINSLGTVVGNVRHPNTNDESNNQHAVMWQDGSVELLGEPPGFRSTQAEAINNLGQVLVWATTLTILPEDAYEHEQQSHLWHSGQWQALEGLGAAHSLNNLGQVVGWVGMDRKTAPGPNEDGDVHAALWEAGAVTDLNDALPQDSGWVLHRAIDINDVGQIAGNGTFKDNFRAFLLTPERL